MTQQKFVDSSLTTVTFKNLRQATLYNVDVFAIRNGKVSNAASGQHLTLIPAPNNFRVVSRNLTDIRVRWEQPRGTHTPISKYKISHVMLQSSEATGPPPQSINFIPPRHKSYRIRGLAPGTQYRVEISVVVSNSVTNENQEGRKAKLVAHTLLGPPVDLRFKQMGFNTALGFQWTPPEGEVTHYEVTLLDKNRVLQRAVVAGTTLNFSFKNLTEGVSYVIKIISKNERLNLESNPLIKEVEIQTSKPSDLKLSKIPNEKNKYNIHASWNPPSIHVKGIGQHNRLD